MDAARIHRWAATEGKTDNRANSTAQISIMTGLKKEQTRPKNSLGWMSGKQWSCSEPILQRSEHHINFCTRNVAKGSLRLTKTNPLLSLSSQI